MDSELARLWISPTVFDIYPCCFENRKRRILLLFYKISFVSTILYKKKIRFVMLLKLFVLHCAPSWLFSLGWALFPHRNEFKDPIRRADFSAKRNSKYAVALVLFLRSTRKASSPRFLNYKIYISRFYCPYSNFSSYEKKVLTLNRVTRARLNQDANSAE